MSPFINDKCMLFKWVLINLVFSNVRPDYHDNSPSNSSFLNGRFVLTSYIRQSTSQFTVCTLAILKHLILRTISVFCNPWDWIYLNTKTELLWNMSETMKQEEVEDKTHPLTYFNIKLWKMLTHKKIVRFNRLAKRSAGPDRRRTISRQIIFHRIYDFGQSSAGG